MYDIRDGHSNGVNLSGTKAAMTYDMSGTFLTNDGTGRVYIGDSADSEQHRELEAIFTGQRGGAFAFFNTSLPNMLPPQSVSISMAGGDDPTAAVGDVGHLVMRRYRSQSGKWTTLQDAEWNEAFGVASAELGDTSGSRWADPGLREWNGGAGGIATFKLSG